MSKTTSMSRNSFRDTLLPEANYYEAAQDMLQFSFFLPKDLLEFWKDHGWTIHPVRVATNEEFLQFYEFIADEILTCTPCDNLVFESKHVGISVRVNASLNLTYVVAKPWFDSRKAQQEQLNG